MQLRSICILASVWCAVQFSPNVWAAAPMDYNGDGFVSEEEFRNHAAKEALDADRNGNGVLDPDEYDLTNAESAAMDTNKDGSIQVSEFQASLMKAFTRLDRNHDGLFA